MSTSPYHGAGKLLDEVLTKHRGLKSVAFSSKDNKLRCTKANYAQVCETLRHKSVIDSILDHDGGRLRNAIQFDDTRSKGLLYVLIYELLFGKYRAIRGGGRLKRNVMKVRKELLGVKEMVVKEEAAAGGGGGARQVPVFPRYVRVNTLKTTTEEVVSILREDLQPDGGAESEDEVASVSIYADGHVPDLLVLPPSYAARLHNHHLVKDGRIVLQDKSSCFPSLALVHGSVGPVPTKVSGGDYIDACAAPGNKTSHLAALVAQSLSQGSPSASGTRKRKGGKKGGGANNRSKIFAFDRSSSRVSILRDRLSDLVPHNESVEMKPMHQDFLKADPKDGTFSNVRSILLDPSCSGSGIVNAPDRHADTNAKGERERIESLANFQLVALKHAMSFPRVERIVYSTCSVNERENEIVMATALRECNEGTEDEEMAWDLVSPACLDHWPRRGHVCKGLAGEEAKNLIRCDGLGGDRTNGFFVSYFERRRFRAEGGGMGGKKKAKGTTLLNPPEGVAIYNGEFDDKLVVKEEDSAADKKGADKKEATSTQGATPKEREGKGKPKEREGKGKKSKKAAKKILWKRKQMELKMRRLEKRKQQAEQKGD